MPHVPLKDVLNKAIWITGSPGCGFNTVGAKLGGFMTDLIGYRSSHLNHREWKISLDVLRYKITDPEMKNPYYYGFAQNFMEVSILPWRMIILCEVSKENLLQRVSAYRKANHIRDGETHEQVTNQLYSLQTELKTKLASNPLVKILDANPPSDELVIEIRKLQSEKGGKHA